MIVYEWCPHDLKVIIMILNDDFKRKEWWMNDEWKNDFGKGQFSLNEWLNDWMIECLELFLNVIYWTYCL